MSTGFDIGIAAKALTPVLQSLTSFATGKVKEGLAKWNTKDFPHTLASKLAIADRVKTVWSRDQFTSLTKCYHPSSIDLEDKRVTVNSLNELSKRNVVIEGIVGQGKSMFLHYLYLQELSGHGSGGLPLLILLRTITAKRSFEDHVKDALSNLEIDPSEVVLDYLAKSGQLIFLLDGFDELDADLVPDTVRAIESLIFKYPTLRVIITSRPNSDIQKSRYFEVLQLSELRNDEYDPFLKKLNIDTIRRHDIISAIEESPADVSELISTPLMLTLVAHVYAAEKEIPGELPLFFERLFVTTFVGHDKQKGDGFRREHHSGLSERKLQLLFEAFCFLTLQKGVGRTLSGEQFADVFEGAEQLVDDISCSVENFKLDITKVACLMLDDGFDQTSFLHMSIAEYFAAAYIKRANEKFASRFYSYVIGKHQTFRVVLSFLEKIDTYRFTKFYVIPALQSLLSALNSTPKQGATKEAWTEFMRQIYEKSEIGIAVKEPEKKLVIRVVRSTAPYSNLSKKFDATAFEPVRRILFMAVINASVSEAALLDNERFYRIEEDDDDPSDAKYFTTIEGVFKIFGEDMFYREFQRVEQSLWLRASQAQALIDNEDSKTDLVSWRS